MCILRNPLSVDPYYGDDMARVCGRESFLTGLIPPALGLTPAYGSNQIFVKLYIRNNIPSNFSVYYQEETPNNY